MLTYLLRRALVAVPTFLLITVVTFLVIHLAPGDPAEMAAGGGTGGRIDERTLAQTRAQFHLDEPLPVQYVLWLKSIVTFDFGTSFQDRIPVRTKVWEALQVSLVLQVIAISLIYAAAVPIGILAATRHDTLLDRGIGFALFVLYSLPNFWVATMLIVYFAGGRYFDWFPIAWLATPGSDDWPFWEKLKDRAWHLVLPILCLTYAGLAGLSRYARTGMLEVIRQDYVRTARAKGLSERRVILKHVARNGLIPVVTLVANLLPALIGGSIIVETIFSIPGMGLLGFQAILARDYPVVMAVLTLAALLTLAGVLLTDVLYVLVDPRITFSKLQR